MGSSTSSTVGKRKKEDDDHSDGSPLKKNKRHDEGLSKKMQLTYVVFRSRDDLNEKNTNVSRGCGGCLDVSEHIRGCRAVRNERSEHICGRCVYGDKCGSLEIQRFAFNI